MISMNIFGKTANILLNILMVGLFAGFIIIGWVKWLVSHRNAWRERKRNMIIPNALLIVDCLYTRLIKKLK